VLIVIDLISRGLNLNTLPRRHSTRRDLITRLRDSGLTHQKIADRLNEMGFPKTNGTPWTRFDVGVSLKKIRDRKKREEDRTVILSVVKAIL
jgi:DNA-binding transcriptional MerR regulator